MARHKPLFHVTYNGPESFAIVAGRTYHQGGAVEVGIADAKAIGRSDGDWTVEQVPAELIATGPQNQPATPSGVRALRKRLGQQAEED